MRDKNTWYVFNHMIHVIYNHEDFEQMQKEFVAELKNIVPNCYAGLFLIDQEDTTKMHPGICHGIGDTSINRRYNLIRDKDFSEWLFKKRQQIVVRTTDLMEEEDFENTDYYKLLHLPYHVHYAVYMTIASRNHLLGILVLYRRKGETDFNEEELLWLQLMGEHLNERFYQEIYADELLKEQVPFDGTKLMKQFGFTIRETEIIHRLLNHETNDTISMELEISIHTLKKHLQHIYRKAGVNSKKKLLQTMTQEK